MNSANPPDPFPGHDGGRWAPVVSDVVASGPQGHFAENLAVDPTGAVYVSLHSHDRIDRFDPKTRKVEEYARLASGRIPGHGALLNGMLKSTRKASPESNSKVMHHGPLTWTM